VIRQDDGYRLCIPLPFVSSEQIELTRSSHDELIIHIGNRKHLLSLPHSLAALETGKARIEGSTLCIDFRNGAET
jgi:hypothetical protein